MPFKKLFKKVGSLGKSPNYSFEDMPFRDYDAQGNLVHEYSPETGFIDYTTGTRYPPNNRSSTSRPTPTQQRASASGQSNYYDDKAWTLTDSHGNVLKSYTPETGVIDHTSGARSPPAQSQATQRTSTQNNYDLPFRDYDADGNLVHEYSPETGFIDYTQGNRAPQSQRTSTATASSRQATMQQKSTQPAAPQKSAQPAVAQQKSTQPVTQTSTQSQAAPQTKTSPEKPPLDTVYADIKAQMQKQFDDSIVVNYQTALEVGIKMIKQFPEDSMGYVSAGKVYELAYKPSVALEYYKQGWEKTQNQELQKLMQKITPSPDNQWIITKLQPVAAHIFKHLSGRDMLRFAATCLYLYELFFGWQPFWDTVGTDTVTQTAYKGAFQRTLKTISLGWSALLENLLYVLADLNYTGIEALVTVSPPDLSSSPAFIRFIEKCGSQLQRLAFSDCSIPCNVPVTTIMKYCPRLNSLIQNYKAGVIEYITPGSITVSNSLGPKYPAMSHSEALQTLQLSFGFIVDKQVILDILRNCSSLETIGLDPVDYAEHDDIFTHVRIYCKKARWFSLSDRGEFIRHSLEQEIETQAKSDKLGIYRVCLKSHRIKVQESVFNEFFKHIWHTLEDLFIPCDGSPIQRLTLDALHTNTPPYLSKLALHGGNPTLQVDSPVQARQDFDETFYRLLANLPWLRHFTLVGYHTSQNVFNLSNSILKSLEQCKKLESVTFLNCIAGTDITYEGVKSWCDSRKTDKTYLHIDCRIFHFISIKDVVLSMTQLRNLTMFHNPVYQNAQGQNTCYCMLNGVSRNNHGIHLDKDMLQSCSDVMKKRESTFVGFENVV